MLVGATALSVLTILSIVSYLLVREYRNTAQEATRATMNIVQLIDRDVRNTVTLYDSALVRVTNLLQSGVLTPLSSPTRQLLLFDRTSELPSCDGFFVVDASGKLISSSRPDQPADLNLTEQPWFKVHQAMANEEVFISNPFQASRTPNDWSIRFSRRMSGPDGEFRGVAVAQMKLSYFTSLLRGLDVGIHGNISLVSTDGTLLMQYPQTEAIRIGQNVSQAPNFIRFLNERYGSFIAMSGLYHVERLYNFSQVRDLPMIVVVALSTRTIFSNWQHTALLIGATTLLLCLGMIWLTWLLLRELRLRQHAERNLAGLASTDPLSGLANRRTLDDKLDHEWRRAQRAGNPISLIMIDVDHFKAFNDTFGHQAGDEALRRVAQVIKAHLRRPADLAARYGGEEFAVVLSDTDATGTRTLAEKIRIAVEHMEPVVPSERTLTISLGACTRYAKPGDELRALVSTADKALYQAKKGGRNRVVDINETGLNALKPIVVP
ncbi:diguanylate cyclase (GGDEF) domain-containing protein [Pseudomonas taetrolens]|uniref:diguanylate cyclase n=1 Tax=Pseudomonas taetrolens TaxID=47884 RepID=A0A0J6GWU5_PSETA|nr:deoxyribonuclease [Pseudomonas taetrolens]SEB68385.1 diguanylate cyclase (GGDEF) domain-containing protein [Pseudomonas taetrolens]SQF85139.1 diguanylate cyclase [Pseudomonas taetrolens]VEH47798.1 diguanylate cyclase [Pseudomonas taetrolens]